MWCNSIKKLFAAVSALVLICNTVTGYAASALSAQETVNADLAAITEEHILSVPLADGYLIDPLQTDSITKGENGSTITWTTSDESIISADGWVTRPQEDTYVTVTAAAAFGTAKAEKSFEFRVAGVFTDIGGLPSNLYPMYTDSFSKPDKIDSRIKTSRFIDGDTVQIENGKLKFSRTEWSSEEAAIAFYRDDSESMLTGTFVTQYTLSKNIGVVRMRMYNSNWNYITQTEWTGDALTIQYRDPSDLSKRTSTKLDAPSDKPLKFTILVNINDSRPVFSMWVNNSEVLHEVISAMDFSPAAFKWIQFYSMQYGNYGVGSYTIDNFGFYREAVDVPTVESMIAENDFSSEEQPNKLITNTTGGGTVKIENGKLVIDKTDPAYSAVGASVYTGADTSAAAAGVIGMEFDAERKNGKTVQIRSMDEKGGLYYSMSWNSDNIGVVYSDDKQTEGSNHTIRNINSKKIHINMLFDTVNSSYWLWVDGKQVISEKYSRSVGVSAICYTMFYLEAQETVYIDNYKIYNAIPPKTLRLKFDTADFGDKDILNETPQAGNIIQSPLNLQKSLRYGTNITWESSNPDIINPVTGALTRPLDVSENPLVTLTAHFENNGIELIRTYSYCVLREFSNSADKYAAEAEDIKETYLTEEAPDKITTSLKLMEKGFYGSDIIWKSDNTNVIANSGRVTRPRFDEPDAEVTLTAQIGQYKKELKFTVLADEPPKDPMYTSDEDFFGVWNGSAFEKTPQLDYSVSGLSKVCEKAKTGDYEGAKQELYSYMTTRNVSSPIGLGTRLTDWVDSRCDGLFSLGEEAAYYRGLVTVTSDAYAAVRTPIFNAKSLPKSKKTFELLARYNENTAAYVMGTSAEKNMQPVLEVSVNGKKRTYTASASASVRAGCYSRQHIDDNSVLTAKMFGEFLGDETYRILLCFDLSDISASDKIDSADLILYARKSVPYADDKQLWIVDNAGQSWDEKTVFWDSLNYVVQNYNGLTGGYNWKGARSGDIEFAYQVPRFMHSRSTMTEYRDTGNEKYAYALLGQVMDLICDTGNKTPYPRSLDAGMRMQQWAPLMNTFKNSRYLTPEFCTAFMKYMYAQFEYFPTRANATGNWREYEQLSVLYASAAYPELSNSAFAKNACIDSWFNAFKNSFLEDGSYVEDTGGYHRSVFSMYLDFRSACAKSGAEIPKEFDETLRKAAYYVCLTNGPAGEMLQYGDEDPGTRSAGGYSRAADLYKDEELRFIDSFGEKGTQPKHTSYHFPDGTYTMMRSDWRKDALYLFTSVRGGGGHGHADDNSIILFGNGRRLLVDSGKFTYNAYDPARIYGLSTQGHNTVLINDTSQRNGWTDDTRGTVHRWLTNSKFDFLSQSTASYPEHEHMRNILFTKKGFVIVSDKMMPEDKTKVNNYKQYWHMLPNANITADNEKKLIYSNFSDGNNIIAASADDAEAELDDGYYHSGSSVDNIKAGFFEKSAAGDVTLDTVLYPTGYSNGSISTERIDTGKPTDKATAMKFTISEKSGKTTYCYMYNYDFENGEPITFDEYSSDARAVLIGVNENGEMSEIIMADGSFIKQNGSVLLDTGTAVSDMAFSQSGSGAELITSDEDVSPESISVRGKYGISSITFNGEYKEYGIINGLIRPTEKTAEPIGREELEKSIIIGETVKSGSGKTYLLDDISFEKTAGAAGEKISYSVSNPSLIDEYGTVTRDTVDREVSITANITEASGATREICFEYTVPGKYHALKSGENPARGERLPQGTAVSKAAEHTALYKAAGDRITIVSDAGGWGAEPGFLYTYGTPLTGKFVQKISFSSDVSNILRFRLCDNKYNKLLDIVQSKNKLTIGDLTYQINGSDVNTVGKRIDLELLFDFSGALYTVTPYINGIKISDAVYISGCYANLAYIYGAHIYGGEYWGAGTTEIYSLDAYRIAENYPSVMKGEVSFGNSSPQQGENKAVIPIVKTTDGEMKAIMYYAVYADGKLLALDMQPVILNSDEHREYTAAVTLDTAPKNAQQRVFIWDEQNVPLQTKPFPF